MKANGKLPISLVVITANEEQNIERCLTAADFCAEQIVVDSGSTDRTLEIAAAHDARILHRQWTGYKDQKNFGSEQASQPWVLCIDADEIISEELQHEIQDAFSTEPIEEGFEINRHGVFGHTLILYRRGSAVWDGPEPHAIVTFKGQLKRRLKGDLYHYTCKDIEQHTQKSIKAARAAARVMFLEGKQASFSKLVFHPFWAFFRTYILGRGFLHGFYGWVIAISTGFYTFSKYAMLREMQREQAKRESA